MSLINNMLKDLKQREARTHDIPHVVLTYPTLRENFYISSKKILLLSIIPFILIISFLLIHFNKKKELTVPAVASNNAIIKDYAASALEDAKWLQPVSITGVTLQVIDNITELTFFLNHPVLYRLNSDNMYNQLGLLLEHAELQSALPPINHTNSVIKQLTAQNINTDIKINLSLNPGAFIKYVTLNNEDKNPELVIGIATAETKTNEIHANSEPQPTPLIKTPAMQSLLSQQYQTAISEVESGRYQAAIEQLSYLIKMDPPYKDARKSLIALLIDQGYQTKAKQILEEGLKLNPDFLPFIELKARMLTNEGKTKNALTLLQSITPPLNDNPDYYAVMAALYERNNDDMLAINLYKQLLSLNPHNGNWWFGLGLSLDKLGKSRTAFQAYSNAVSEGHLNPESFAYLQNRLKALEEANNEKG